MALNATVVWRIRPGGDDLNGGAYDAAVSGAGTDYSQQDAAQLSLTDGACLSTTTTFTSAMGGFTAAMIGNMLAISAGTNALKQHFMITGHTDTNTVTLDRTPTTGGDASGVTFRVGGAKGNPSALSNGGSVTAPTVTQTAGLAAGHTIYIQGAGADIPSADDYTQTGFAQYASGDGTSGSIRWFSENGRPQISCNGLCFFNLTAHSLRGFKGKFTGDSNGSIGFISGAANTALHDIVVDQNGQDVVGATVHAATRCTFYNSGATTASTRPALVSVSASMSIFFGNRINAWRGGGIDLASGNSDEAMFNLITNCNVFGIRAVAASNLFTGIFQNTIHNCVSNILTADAEVVRQTLVWGNLLTGATNGANYNVGSTALNDRRQLIPFAFNAYYGNTNDVVNISKGSADITLSADPYVNSAAGDYGLNTTSGGGAACRGAAYPGVPWAGGSLNSPTGYLDIGAIQAAGVVITVSGYLLLLGVGS